MSKKRQEEEKQYASITMAAIGGQISGIGLYPEKFRTTTYTTHLASSSILPELAEGGYVLDLRPLADHPDIVHWVLDAPMANHRIDGEDIDRLSGGARVSASYMMGGMDGVFQLLATMAATGEEGVDDSPVGPFDRVSAAYLARYWGSRGARIGKRVGNVLCWSDGQTQPIETAKKKEKAV